MIANCWQQLLMIDIRQEPYLPFSFRIFSFIVLAFGGKILLGPFTLLIDARFSDAIANAPSYLFILLVGLFFIILGLIMLTAHYRLQINTSQKTYRNYVWLLGLSSGKSIKFDHVTKIFINQVNEKSIFTSRAGLRYDIRKKVYKAFMKLDNGAKIHLDTPKSETKLRSRIYSYITKLNGLYNPELDN